MYQMKYGTQSAMQSPTAMAMPVEKSIAQLLATLYVCKVQSRVSSSAAARGLDAADVDSFNGV